MGGKITPLKLIPKPSFAEISTYGITLVLVLSYGAMVSCRGFSEVLRYQKYE
jgi:hypothetical protein